MKTQFFAKSPAMATRLVKNDAVQPPVLTLDDAIATAESTLSRIANDLPQHDRSEFWLQVEGHCIERGDEIETQATAAAVSAGESGADIPPARWRDWAAWIVIIAPMLAALYGVGVYSVVLARRVGLL